MCECVPLVGMKSVTSTVPLFFSQVVFRISVSGSYLREVVTLFFLCRKSPGSVVF